MNATALFRGLRLVLIEQHKMDTSKSLYRLNFTTYFLLCYIDVQSHVKFVCIVCLLFVNLYANPLKVHMKIFHKSLPYWWHFGFHGDLS